ncbi:MAG: hypothetical protein K2Q26_07190 [Bdellovibrionales bacterium]|nr:hypothetical protein [Bdellovibrionales bacterium]
MNPRILVFLFFIYAGTAVNAQVPGSFVYQGQITKAGGIPLEANPVVFNVRVYSPVNDCLMYEEQHSINMLGSEGMFSLNVGAGIRTGSDYEDTSVLPDVLKNGISFTGITTCAAGNSYSALSGHTRKVRISYNDGGGGVTLAQDFHLQSVPYAWYANSLQGYVASNFVQINPGQNLTQSNLENLFGGSNYNTLYNLASGTSTAPLSMNNQQIKNLANPTLAQDAATKNYADTKIAGANIDVSGVGAGVGDGRVLSWNATLSRWEATTPSAITDATKLPLAGGTMAGNINLNGNQLLNAGHITLQNLSTVTLGKFNTAQETTLVGTLTVGNKGATWYNTDTDKLMYWDGNSAETVGNGSGAGDIESVATNAGSALTGGAMSGAVTLSVVTDATTIETNGSNQLQVKDSGITNAKINSMSITKLTSAAAEYFSYMPAGTECTNNYTLVWDSTNDRWICGALPSNFTQLTDTDGDTRIQTEESADEDRIRFDTAGTERMIITATGDIGIGTTNPQSLLDVAGTIRANQICDENGANCKDISTGWGAGGDIDGVTTSAGSALSGGAASGNVTLSVVTDGTTIETNGSNQLQVRDAGISLAKLAADSVNSSKIVNDSIVNADINASAAIAWSKIDKTGAAAGDVGAVPSTRNLATNTGSALTGGGNLSSDRSLSVSVDNTTIEIATNSLQVKDSGITNAKINSVSVGKITSAVAEYFTYMPAGTECTDGYTLIWNTISDRWICGALPTNFTAVADADNDTKIQVEESADEDKIRFDTAGTERMIIDEAGRVGIGTTTPSYSLSVGPQGTGFANYTSGGSADDAMKAVGNNAGANFGVQNLNAAGFSGVEYINSAGAVSVFTGFNNSNGQEFRFNNIAPNGYINFMAGGSTRLHIANNGNIGIGTTNPSSRIDVAGGINSTTGMTVSSWTGGYISQNPFGSVRTYTGTNGSTEGEMYLADNTATTTVHLRSNGNSYFNSGNVGIGTTSPQAKLDVSGTIRAEQICDETGANCKDISTGWTAASGDIEGIVTNAGSALTGGATSGTATLAVQTDGSTLEVNGSNQLQIRNAGVGTAQIANSAVTSAKILSVSVGKIANAAGEYFSYMPAGTECNNGEILTWNAVSDRWLCSPPISRALADADDDTKIQVEESADEDRIRFDTAGTERMVIDNSGNVGVGSATPSAKLDVNGTINASGFTINGSNLVTGGMQSPVTQNATIGASCSNVGELAKDGSGNLLVCDDTPSLLNQGTAGCSTVGTGAMTIDENGVIYVCLN